MIGKIEDFINDNIKRFIYPLMASPFIVAILIWSKKAIEASQWSC